MTDYSTLTNCREITDDCIQEAAESREDMRALFERAVEIARPRAGGARVLLLFAKIASPACDWLEGALRVQLTADADNADNTVIESVVEIGAGLKERVFPKRKVNVPLVEFEAAIKKFPQALAPLTAESGVGKVVLAAPEAEKGVEVVAKPVVAIDATDIPAVGGPRPLAKLKLRKQLPARGSEIVPPKRAAKTPSKPPKTASKPPKTASKPPKTASKPPKPPAKDDVDKGWDE